MPVHSSFWLQIAAGPWVMRTVCGNLHKADSWVHCCCSCSCCWWWCCCSWSWTCTCVAALPDLCPVLVPLAVIAQVQSVLRLRPVWNDICQWMMWGVSGVSRVGRTGLIFGLKSSKNRWCHCWTTPNLNGVLPEHWETSPPNSAALTVTLHDLLPSHFSWTLYIASLDRPRVFLACWQM